MSCGRRSNFCGFISDEGRGSFARGSSTAMAATPGISLTVDSTFSDLGVSEGRAGGPTWVSRVGLDVWTRLSKIAHLTRKVALERQK